MNLPLFAPLRSSIVQPLWRSNLGRTLLAAVFVAGSLPAATWTLDPSFAPTTYDENPAEGAVTLTPLPDGRLLARGGFGFVGNTPRPTALARLAADGTLDSTFVTNFAIDEFVVAVAPLADGQVLAEVHTFTYGYVNSFRLVRLSVNGNVDPTYPAPALSGYLDLQPLPDGRVLALGSSGTIDGAPHHGLLRFDAHGVRDTTFASAVTGVSVNVAQAIGTPDGKLYVSAIDYRGDAAAPVYFVRLNADGSVDPAFQPSPPGRTFHQLALLADGSLLAGNGDVLRFLPDGTRDMAFALDFSSVANRFPGAVVPPYVNSLAVLPDGTLAVDATVTSPTRAVGDRSIWIFTAQGALLRDLGAAIAPDYHTELLGAQADGQLLIRIGLPQWIYPWGQFGDAPASSSVAASQGPIRSLTKAVLGRARADATQLDPLPARFYSRDPGGIWQLAADNAGRVIAGGYFTHVNGQPRAHVARFLADGTLDPAFVPPPLDGSDRSILLTQPDGRAIVQDFVLGPRNAAGYYPTIGRYVRLRVDGSVDPDFAPPSQAMMQWHAADASGRLLVSYFTPDNSVEENFRIAWLDANGRLASELPVRFGGFPTYYGLPGYPTGLGNPLSTVTLLNGGSIGVAGGFTVVDGVARPGLARLRADGTLDPGFVPLLTVHPASAEFLADGRVVILEASFATGHFAYGRSRLRADGGRDPTFPRLPEAALGLPYDRVTGLPDLNLPDTFTLPGGHVATRQAALEMPGGSLWVTAQEVGDDYELRFVRFTRSNVPAISVQPAPRTITAGRDTYLQVAIGTDAPASYQWLRDGIEIPDANGPLLLLPHVGSAQAGVYTVRVTIGASVFVSTGAAVTVAPSTARLVNFSARSRVRPGAPQIGGFVLRSGAARQVLLRAVGMGLSLIDSNLRPLPDGRLQLFASDTRIGENRGGLDDLDIRALADRVGAFRALPSNPNLFPADVWGAALAPSLVDGAYTAQTSSTDAREGISLFELYDAAEPATGRLLDNVSLRGRTAPDADTLIGGFVVDGEGPLTLLLRVVGPELAQWNLPGALTDPTLKLFGGSLEFGANDNWSTQLTPGPITISAATIATGAFPLDPGSKSAALVVALEPGAYTVHAGGAGNSAGEVLLEIYVIEE